MPGAQSPGPLSAPVQLAKAAADTARSQLWRRGDDPACGLTMITSLPPRAAEGGVAAEEATQEGRRKVPHGGHSSGEAPAGASGEGGLTQPLASSPGTILDSRPPELKDTSVRLEATEFVESGCRSPGDRDQEPPKLTDRGHSHAGPSGRTGEEGRTGLRGVSVSSRQGESPQGAAPRTERVSSDTGSREAQE